MYYKEEREKNPSRCKELRDIEKGIKAQRDSNHSAFTTIMNDLRKLREKRAQLGERGKNLTILIAGATAVSGGRSAVGHVLSGTSSTLATQLAVLESEIKSIEDKISELESQISVLKNNGKILDRSLQENARQLSELNCVR